MQSIFLFKLYNSVVLFDNDHSQSIMVRKKCVKLGDICEYNMYVYIERMISWRKRNGSEEMCFIDTICWYEEFLTRGKIFFFFWMQVKKFAWFTKKMRKRTSESVKIFLGREAGQSDNARKVYPLMRANYTDQLP